MRFLWGIAGCQGRRIERYPTELADSAAWGNVVAIVPGTGWAVEFLINDGDRQVELKGFLSL